MKPLFHCKLLNAPFGDPALYIEILHQRQALLFDLGDIRSLGDARILKVSHVFVSHAHIDHFFGFDHLLRVVLGRDKQLTLYGPPGITSHVAGKLSGYTWNLVKDYLLRLRVGEMHGQDIHFSCFVCADQFSCEAEASIPFDGTLEENPHFGVASVQLDHKIPSLAFSLKERFHINVNKAVLRKWGLPVGPWLRELKERIWEDKPERDLVRIPLDGSGEHEIREISLGELKKEVVTITPGQKIVYVADCSYSPDNVDRIVKLAEDADIFFCEAAFLDRDRDKARAKNHLTARQAGIIAREAGVKQLHTFHFSPRYEEAPEHLEKEAQEAFRGTGRE